MDELDFTVEIRAIQLLCKAIKNLLYGNVIFIINEGEKKTIGVAKLTESRCALQPSPWS